MRISIFLFTIFLFPIVAFSQTVDVSKAPTIEVTGTAEINVVPDEVSISLNISKTNRDLSAAKSQNDEGVTAILGITRRFGIDAKDVKTDFITVKEKTERRKIPNTDDEYRDVFIGYTVSKTVVVKLRDIKRFEEFFSDVVKAALAR